MEISKEPQQDHGDLGQRIEIRLERPEDFDAIRAMLRDAFGRDFEAEVVDRLRASDGYLPHLSLVALKDGKIVGHIMITTQDIVTDDCHRIASTILAPLAVDPAHQGEGIGQALTRAALHAARDVGHRSMMLVGHPAYYPRFGFRPASTWGIRFATPIPDEAFMAIELAPGGLMHASGTVKLPSAFDEH